jgi:hypothetical protein
VSREKGSQDMRFWSETILKEPVSARNLPAILQNVRPVEIRLWYFGWILKNLSINSRHRFEIRKHKSEWDNNEKET